MRGALVAVAAMGLAGCFSEATLLAQCVDAGRCPFVGAEGDGGAGPDAGGSDAGPDAGTDGGATGQVLRPHDVVIDINLAFVGAIAGGKECYRSAVLTRSGAAVGIPCNRSDDGGLVRVLVMNPDGGLRAIGGVSDVTRDSWYAGVLGVDGFVYAIPYSDEYFLRIDPETGTTTRVGPALGGAERFRGGLVLRDGRIFAVPDGLSQAVLFDPRDAGLTFVASGMDASVRGVGGTLLGDGTAVFASLDGLNTSTIWTFDGVTLTQAGQTASVGRALSLADGGALFLPRNSDQLVAWPGGASTSIDGLWNLTGRERLVAGAMTSGRQTAFALSRTGMLVVSTPLGAAVGDAGTADGGRWWTFTQFEHLLGLPDGRLVAFPLDPNDSALILNPQRREPVPVEVMSAPAYNHY